MKSLSRRSFMKRTGLAAALAAGAAGSSFSIIRGAETGGATKMKAMQRPDLPDGNSARGIEVIQLTTQTDVPASHLYMEAQVFTSDSKRFLLHLSAGAHGGSKDDPRHQYFVCDLDNGCELSPITNETGATATSVSPDDKYVYYFVDETEPGGGRLTLKRVNLDGSDRRVIMVIDKPLPDTQFRPSRIYPLSTISSDGKRLALSCFLGDGRTENMPWGLMAFDLEKASVQLILQGTSWVNVHPQYSRSRDPKESRDILVQDNHDNQFNASGTVTKLVGGDGADIHVIRDDGSDMRNMPWGRDGNEFCQGHQCWRGRSAWAITSTGTRNPPECQLIEGLAAPHAGHIGLKTPGGRRNDLSREFPNPKFYHFATDIAGERMITDCGPLSKEAKIYAMELGKPGEEPLRNFRYLLSPKSSCLKGAHIHPFLSPDGRTGFFNSDESGRLQAYMIRGL
ncbi:MAG TPA: twin-arginine translocation signal domain-containing protein [Candidatus Brocadiia bacterium]|nr:twin-arginine translocation signal domain-containing protein [Candidatus Brocadiia bacterium]